MNMTINLAGASRGWTASTRRDGRTVNDNMKKTAQLRQPVCHLVRAQGFTDKAVDPFNERLRAETLSHDSLAEFSSHLQKHTDGNLQIIAGLGKINLQSLLSAEINALVKASASRAKQSGETLPASVLLNWGQMSGSMRSMAVAAETIMNAGFNGSFFEPTRLMGWGFAKSSEAIDPGSDRAKALRCITQAFQRRYCRDQRIELAKSLFASVVAHAAGCLPQRLDIAFDGAALLCGFQMSCDGATGNSLQDLALRLAAWLDLAGDQSQHTLTGWVRQKAPLILETGVIFDATEAQTALIVEPRLEQTTQVSYNVA
ncbi:MAG: hypothetical protein RIQ81_1403 [Pseudomonadota bacterium]